MGRVLRPAGRLGLRVWRALEHQAFFRALVAALDRHLWNGQDVPSRAGFGLAFSLGDAEELRDVVGSAGFRDIDIQVSTVPIRFAATIAAMKDYLSALPIGSEIATMQEAARIATLQEVITALQPLVEQDQFVIPAECHVVLARR